MADPLAQTMFAEGFAGAPELAGPPSLGDEAGPRVIAGRYEILGLLGAGGMGNVYKARDRELEEMVALKVLRPEIAGNAAALERFRREVKLARRVTHPNVARVFDIGDGGGEKYLTMELLDGEPLGALLAREGKVSTSRALSIAAAVCAGLGAAHAAGVIHRDLKPDNVLLTRDGRVVVTDFGIARAAAQAEVNLTGAIVGTPAYMAPEQVEGRPVDARADIYALGAMLFETITGQLPWQGDNVFTVAAARLLRPPPDPGALRPDLPAELCALVQKCMARAPEERFANVEELMVALATVPQGGPLSGALASARGGAGAGAATSAVTGTMTAAPTSFERARGRGTPTSIGASLVPAATRKQVAVLPLRNVGPRENEHIADGLTEELIDLLSMAPDLRVRSRGTVMRYREGDRDPREIGRELDVPVVVEGSVRREQGHVRVAVRLVSVADGVQIWHRRFDRPEAELFAVGDEAARAISEALAAPLTAPAREAPASAEALDLYLRARAAYLRFFDDLKGDSIQLYERALALAPDDARILAGYAMANGRLWRGNADQLDRARRAAERAVERAPNLPESHVALAVIRYQERREPETVASLRRALRLSRLNAEAHDMLGRILGETELLDPARRHLETALALEPELQLPRVMLGRIHVMRGDWAAAERALEDGGVSAAALPSTARMCLWSGDAERARRILADQGQHTTMAWELSRLILETVAHRAEWPARPPVPGDLTPKFLAFLAQVEAECAAYTGNWARALDAIERASQRGIFDLAWMDKCPLFEPIRSDPRFLAAREPIRLRARQIADAYLAPEG